MFYHQAKKTNITFAMYVHIYQAMNELNIEHDTQSPISHHPNEASSLFELAKPR